MPSWTELAINEMGGFTWDSQAKSYEGWGGNWQEANKTSKTVSSKIFGIDKVSNTGFPSYALSIFRSFSTASSVLSGYSSEGLTGAAKWGAAEFITSGMIASRAATGLGFLGQAGMSGGGALGMIATGGSPAGYVGGTYLAGMLMEGGTLATLAGAGTIGVVGAGMATAVGAYYAGKGAYSILKNGYNYRQRMMKKIDTAGSTAAFMNRNAFTMRSKAAEAMKQNYMGIRSAFGHEATRTHFNAYRKTFNTGLY